MNIKLIHSEEEITSEWHVLFRCYDAEPFSTDITNKYIVQIWTNVDFGEVAFEDGTKFVDQCIQGIAEHLQGVKSIWHRFLRFLDKFDNEGLEVIFLNEFNNLGTPYRAWINEMFNHSLIDSNYDLPNSKEVIKLNWPMLVLGDYFPDGKFKGCRIEGKNKQELEYLNWLKQNTNVKFCDSLLKLLN